MQISALSDDDKPREKALAQGIGVLTDAELLAILLRTGVRGKNVVEISQEILAKFDNNLARLARVSPRELATLVPGIGPAKAMTVIAALELGSRCRTSAAMQKPQMTGSNAIYEYIRGRVEDLDHEQFWVIYMSRRLAADFCERVSTGGMDSTLVDMRILMKKVLDARAAAIAVVHNHPSGSLAPSMADDTLTRRIKEACALLDVRLVDHLIISPSGYYSYADESRL